MESTMTSSRASAPSPLTLETSECLESSRSAWGRAPAMNASSIAGSDASQPRSPVAPRKPASPTMNAHTTCGRHTDQFLFSGPSLADMARSLLGRNRSESGGEDERR